MTTSTDLVISGRNSGGQPVGIQFIPGIVTGVASINNRAGLFYGAFDIGKYGTYTDSTADTLNITGSPAAPVAVTPEPCSLALLDKTVS